MKTKKNKNRIMIVAYVTLLFVTSFIGCKSSNNSNTTTGNAYGSKDTASYHNRNTPKDSSHSSSENRDTSKSLKK